MTSSSSRVPCPCPKEPLPSQPEIQRLGAGLTVLRLLNVVSQVLFLRPTESPEFLELTEQFGDKRLKKKWVRLRHGVTPTTILSSLISPLPHLLEPGKWGKMQAQALLSLLSSPLGLLLPPEQQSILTSVGLGQSRRRAWVEESRQWVLSHRTFPQAPTQSSGNSL